MAARKDLAWRLQTATMLIPLDGSWRFCMHPASTYWRAVGLGFLIWVGRPNLPGSDRVIMTLL